MDSIETFREELGICWRIAALRLRGQMEYRSSFLMQLMGSFIINFSELLVLFTLFSRFDTLGGWSLQEVIFLHAMSQITFSVADTISNGIQTVPAQIREGDFDRVLVRPLSSYLQAIVSDVSLRHIGMLIQGVIILAYALMSNDISWTPLKLVVFVAAIASGIALFTSLFTVEAIISFWTVNSIEAINAFTYGGSDLAQYPLHIFARSIRWIFLWIVPIGFVVYYPSLVILDKPDPLDLPPFAPYLAPLMAGIFCIAIGFAWKLGIRHYRSTGS